MSRHVLALLATVVIAGCGTPTRPDAPGVVFAKPAAEVQKAAINALVVVGFKVEKSDAFYVEGFKTRSMGLFVGSGGETVGIWIEPVGPERTRVRVDTAKSALGIVGQRNWDADIMAALERELERPR